MSFLSAIAGPLIGAVAGGLGGSEGQDAQAAPTTFETLPSQLQDFSEDSIFPRLQDLFTRDPVVTPKAQALSPTADPLFASSELFKLQQFANANNGATTIEPPKPTVVEPISDGISLAEEFIKGLNAPVLGSARGQALGKGRFTGDIASQLQSFGDLDTLSTVLADQGFNRATNVTPDTLRGLDLSALIAAAQGVTV